MSWTARLKALRLDTTPLRASRDFRLLFLAGTVFYFGAMVSYVAIPYQIYTLTGSNFAVGAVGLVELVPLVVFGLYGGALADHVDRRKLLVSTGIAQAAFTAVLLSTRSGRPEPLGDLRGLRLPGRVLVVAAAVARSADAAHRHARPAPGRQRADQPRHAARVLVGPAVGGLLVAYVGIGWCFLVDIGGLGVASLMFVLMRPYPHRAETTPPSLAGIEEGMVYAVRREDLLGTYLVDIAAMFLAMPVVLFPALAEEVFGTRAARPALLRRDRRGTRRDRAERLDRPHPPPRPGDRDRRCGLRRVRRRSPA